MSRHGYSEDYGEDDPLALGRYRAAVRSALRGRRGQAFLRELIAALDALPEKKLITDELEENGCYCAFGAVGRAHGIDMSKMTMRDDDERFDAGLPEAGGVGIEEIDAGSLGVMFNVADSLAREIMYVNDECGRGSETPEDRWTRVRRWAERKLIEWE